MTNNISDTLRMMDVVDDIQRARSKSEGLVQNDADLMSKVREVYVSQGLPVDDEVLGIAFQKLYGRLPGQEQSLVPLVQRDEAGEPVRPKFPESRIIEERFPVAGIVGLVIMVLGGSAVAWLWNDVRSVPQSLPAPVPVAPPAGIGEVAAQVDSIANGMMPLASGGLFLMGLAVGVSAMFKFKAYADALNERSGSGDLVEGESAAKLPSVAPAIVLAGVSSMLLAAPVLLKSLF